jgi:hypothetical protein
VVTEVTLIVCNSIHKTLSGRERRSPDLELWFTGAPRPCCGALDLGIVAGDESRGQPAGPHSRLSASLPGPQPFPCQRVSTHCPAPRFLTSGGILVKSSAGIVAGGGGAIEGSWVGSGDAQDTQSVNPQRSQNSSSDGSTGWLDDSGPTH